MIQPRTVVLDNEAVQALAEPRHRKHRRAIAIVQAATTRNRRQAGSVHLAVPTAVRVEAGWDRHSPRAASVNRLGVDDLRLDTEAANHAASIRTKLSLSVADAHIAAVLKSLARPHTVVTSDIDDVRRITDYLEVDTTIVRI